MPWLIFFLLTVTRGTLLLKVCICYSACRSQSAAGDVDSKPDVKKVRGGPPARKVIRLVSDRRMSTAVKTHPAVMAVNLVGTIVGA